VTVYEYRDQWEHYRRCKAQENPISNAMENVADEAMHQIQEHFEYLYNMIARSALSMRPVYSGGAYVTRFETETAKTRPTSTPWLK
jgi:hypothetical protein